jgi:hypothetical protein
MALFIALGGTALASFVVSSNSQIGPGTVSGHKPPAGKHANLIGRSVNATDLARRAVTQGRLGANAVTTGKVLNGSLTGADMSADTLTGQQIDESTLGGVRPDVYQGNTTSDSALSSDADTFTDVVKVSVPAGPYIVWASGTAVDLGGSADIIRCGITASGFTPGATYAASLNTTLVAAPISPVTGIGLGDGFDLALRCEHDTAQTGTKIDAGAKIVAMPIVLAN